MLASDIFCIILVVCAILAVLLATGLTLDYLNRRETPKWISFVAAFVGVLFISFVVISVCFIIGIM